jgi:hypothetical protein
MLLFDGYAENSSKWCLDQCKIGMAGMLRQFSALDGAL